TGSLDGGADSDTLNLGAYTTAVTVNLNSAGASGANGTTAGAPNPITAGFSNIDEFDGGTAGDTFNVNADVAAILRGNAGTDSFVLVNGAELTGSIDGGADIDTLNLTAYTTDVTINLAA